MNRLVAALIAEMDDRELERLAERLAPKLRVHLQVHEAEPWMSAAEAAAYMATSRDRLYDLVQLGYLTPRRDGRRLLFTREQIDEYLYSSRST